MLKPLLAWLEANGKGRGVVLLGSRNSLLSQTCKKIGANHRSKSSDSEMRSPDSRTALCFDSILKLPEADGRILLLDEATSSIKHAIAGATCSRERMAILDRYHQEIKRAEIVICLDGNMTDWVSDYLKTLRGNDSGIVKVLNVPKPQTIPLEIIPEFRQSGLTSKILEVMPLVKRQGKAIAIACDSLRLSKRLTSLFTTRGYKVLCINSETMTQEEVKAWIEHPVRGDYDILIYTPSCESGLDIPFEGFAYTYAFFCGIVDTATQIQMLRRVRKVEGIIVQCVPYTRSIFSKSVIFPEFVREMEDALLDDGNQHTDRMIAWLEKHRDNPHYQEYHRIIYSRNH